MCDTTEKIWDEMIKAITERMPYQLLPLIEEVFKKNYPIGTTVKLLATEHIVPQVEKNHSGSRTILSDITILVGDKDIYHLECQMTNDNEMILRMYEYDFHIALSHGKIIGEDGSITLQFPHSVVMYPGTNKKIPDELSCNVLMPDNSSHTFKIPTIKVQNYSLDDIRKKHLTVFIPFTLLRFRPRLTSKTNPIKENELTEFVSQLIFILEEEVKAGNLTPTGAREYSEAINNAARRIFAKHFIHKEEVLGVTKSKMIFMTEKIEILEAKVAEKDETIAKKDEALAEKDEALAEKDAEIARLKELLKT